MTRGDRVCVAERGGNGADGGAQEKELVRLLGLCAAKFA